MACVGLVRVDAVESTGLDDVRATFRQEEKKMLRTCLTKAWALAVPDEIFQVQGKRDWDLQFSVPFVPYRASSGTRFRNKVLPHLIIT